LSFDKEQIYQPLKKSESNFNLKKLKAVLKRLNSENDIDLVNHAYMSFIKLIRAGEISPFEFLSENPMTNKNK